MGDRVESFCVVAVGVFGIPLVDPDWVTPRELVDVS
jgi:hypothetical protein